MTLIAPVPRRALVSSGSPAPGAAPAVSHPGTAALIIEGNGLIATAFRRYGDHGVPGIVFARGVADSATTDPAAFLREIAALEDALKRAREIDEPLLFFSSAPVYGDFGGGPVRETSPLRPTSDYGRHKLACEALVRATDGPSLILRIPNAVGPGGHPSQLVPALVAQVLGGSATVFEGAARDLIGVEEIVWIAQLLVVSDASTRLAPLDRTLNVASGVSTPVATIVRTIAAILGLEPAITLAPGGQRQTFDVSRLAEFVPMERFTPEYPDRVLCRHVPALAEVQRASRGATAARSA